MPVVLWREGNAVLHSEVVTNWETVLLSEEHRPEARALDSLLDSVLDRVVDDVNAILETQGKCEPTFARAWAVGNELRVSDVVRADAMVAEPEELLWRALARKCRYGVRADGTRDASWLLLRPARAEEPRREGKRLDHFKMCLWLAEQTFDDAQDTFGSHIRNVWQMLERLSLRPLGVRIALLKWMRQLPRTRMSELQEPKTFPEVMKTLQKRWPAKGPGSARKPIHFTQDELDLELARVLEQCK